MKIGNVLCCNGNFHILVVASADSLAEHMSESVGFLHFLGVETEHRLVNVPLKVCLADEVVSAEDDTLEVSPKAFNAVGGE